MSQHVAVDGMNDKQETNYYNLYWIVFIVLCVCTGMSFLFNVGLGQGAASAALISIVAVIKAGLVVMIFMHLKFDWGKVAAIMVPVLIMCVMTVIILSIDQALVWHDPGAPQAFPPITVPQTPVP